MKITHISLLFISIFILLFLEFGFYINQVISANDSNLKEERTMLSSTDSAIESGESQKTMIFDDEDIRWSAVAALQNIYGKNNNTITEDKKVTNKYHLSTTFLVDWNGYYMEYENSYKNENGNTESKEEMTGLNTWTETYGDYVVNFRLDEDVVVYHEQTSCGGHYADIYASLGSPEELNFMSDPELFKEERNITIATIMNEQVNYYTNTKNVWFNTYDANYLITINSASRIPYSVINKNGRLTAGERELINKHPLYGAQILNADNNIRKEVVEIALYHHERMNGSGYPFGVSTIPPEISVVSISAMEKIYGEKDI